LESHGKGSLSLYGGEYGIRSDTSTYRSPLEELGDHPRLKFHGIVPVDQLWEDYASATLAIDLTAPNPERELNLSFRQIDYLRCGLPIITAPGQVIAQELLEYGAGWVIEPGDDATPRFAGNLTGQTQTLPLAIMTAMESSLETALALSVLLLVGAMVVLVALGLLTRRRWQERI